MYFGTQPLVVVHPRHPVDALVLEELHDVGPELAEEVTGLAGVVAHYDVAVVVEEITIELVGVAGPGAGNVAALEGTRSVGEKPSRRRSRLWLCSGRGRTAPSGTTGIR